MAKNKYDFIQELLSNKKLTLSQKERVLQLSAEEIKKDNETESSLESRIKQLESYNNNSNLKKSIKNHSPKEMINFLFKFSNDENFKWFTHPADDNSKKIDYRSKLDKVSNELRLIENSNLNLNTINYVRDFMIAKKNLREDLKICYPSFKTTYTYTHPEIIDRIYNGENPFDIKIGSDLFSNIITKFKHSIEFRSDDVDSHFKKLFQDFIIDESVPNEKFSAEFGKGGFAITYIDVNNFFEGIGMIIKWIKKYFRTDDSIEFGLIDSTDNDYVDLEIFHKNGFFRLESKDKKMQGLSGDFETLRKRWFSIVDLRILADSPDFQKTGSYIIDSLDCNTTMEVSKGSPAILSKNNITNSKEKIGGIKYIIRMYKNK